MSSPVEMLVMFVLLVSVQLDTCFIDFLISFFDEYGDDEDDEEACIRTELKISPKSQQR